MNLSSTLPIMTVERKRFSVIGAKIQRLRKAKGWSQGDLASNIGRQQSRVAKWELGQGKPEPHDLLRISRALDVSLLFLCDDSMSEPTKEDGSANKPTQELTRDERLLADLAERYGAGTIVDTFLGMGGGGEATEATVAAKHIGAHTRRVRPTE